VRKTQEGEVELC